MHKEAKPFVLALVVAFLVVVLFTNPCCSTRQSLQLNSDKYNNAPGTLFIPANDERLRYTGRYHYSPKENAVLFDWPCFSINVSFTGFTSLSVVMDGGNNNFISFLNNIQTPIAKIRTNDQKNVYPLFSNLSSINTGNASTHVLSLFKITEASYIFWQPLLPVSEVRFYGLIAEGEGKLLSGNDLLPINASMRRRIEVFGDSDSNGTNLNPPPFICSALEDAFLVFLFIN